jgi:hypothetical protein
MCGKSCWRIAGTTCIMTSRSGSLRLSRNFSPHEAAQCRSALPFDRVRRAAFAGGGDAAREVQRRGTAGADRPRRTRRPGRGAGHRDEIGLRFVDGVEISISWGDDQTVHIVGLGIDPANAELVEGLHQVRSGRDARAGRMAAELDKVGIHGAYEGALRSCRQSGAGESLAFRPLHRRAGPCQGRQVGVRSLAGQGQAGLRFGARLGHARGCLALDRSAPAVSR